MKPSPLRPRDGPKFRDAFGEPVAFVVLFDPFAAAFQDAESVSQIGAFGIRDGTVLEGGAQGFEVAGQGFGIGSVG